MKRPAAPRDFSPPSHPFTYAVRAIMPEDAATVVRLVRERWGGCVVVHGIVYRPETLPGFIIVEHSEPVGLVTYHVAGKDWEIVTLDSLRQGKGVGTALLEALREAAQEAGAVRLWLTTTNDNLDALRFFQRRGCALVAVHRRAVDQARRFKRTIPVVGAYSIPIRDELELEWRFNEPLS